MFNKDFYPTPAHVLDIMLEGEKVEGKVCYDPEGGKGDIVDRLKLMRAKEVISSELNDDLRTILKEKCAVIGENFLKITAEQISHVELIVMNPPFSADEKHILHAFNIAPDGCKIISLCNYAILQTESSRMYRRNRYEIKSIIEDYGFSQNLGNCFSTAERKTRVEVGLIKLQKPGGSYDQQFDGFMLEDVAEEQANGLIPYNLIRDLVNRYITAVKIYDEQLTVAERLSDVTKGYFGTSELGMGQLETSASQFKKELQKSGWNFVFNKLNMQKYSTKGLKQDINKFVESQQHIPFTMFNIYKMIEIVIGTQKSRMDKAIIEVFDNVTRHTFDNRYNVEGFKTNSHYLLNRRFIVTNVVGLGSHGEISRPSWSYSNFEMIEDLVKALCYILGKNYNNYIPLEDFVSYRHHLVKDGVPVNTGDGDSHYSNIHSHDLERVKASQEHHFGSEVLSTNLVWGSWFEWGFFRCKAYKKGTMHFEFLSEDVWAKFNLNVARIKGYPLPDFRNQTEWQKRNYRRKRENV